MDFGRFWMIFVYFWWIFRGFVDCGGIWLIWMRWELHFLMFLQRFIVEISGIRGVQPAGRKGCGSTSGQSSWISTHWYNFVAYCSSSVGRPPPHLPLPGFGYWKPRAFAMLERVAFNALATYASYSSGGGGGPWRHCPKRSMTQTSLLSQNGNHIFPLCNPHTTSHTSCNPPAMCILYAGPIGTCDMRPV